MRAVLTGDIVNSMTLEPHLMDQLVSDLRQAITEYKHEFFRGDSFQVYFEDPAHALRSALICRTTALRYSSEETKIDARIAVGIGNVDEPVSELATARGEAFLLSGRSLDEMGKSGGRIQILTHQTFSAITLKIISDYANSLVGRLTQKQAEVIHELLQGLTQQQVSEKLGRSKSTISQHVNAAEWDALDNLISDYESVVSFITTNSIS